MIQEIAEKGWIDQQMLNQEIELHLSNAATRIEALKNEAKKIGQKMHSHELAVLSEYWECVGRTVALCCLEGWCKDFMFTSEDVEKIIKSEGERQEKNGQK